MNDLTFSSEIIMNTEFGYLSFKYARLGNKEALIVSKEPIENSKKITVRIHSSCVFSESFHTINCDCADQLTEALKYISNHKNGIVIYLFDEGRGVGLMKKIEAIKLQQDLNIDTVEAFKRLGYSQDERGFELAIEILKSLYPYQTVDLITNNPLKMTKLKEAGITIGDIIPSIHHKNDEIKDYLIEKGKCLGHIIPTL